MRARGSVDAARLLSYEKERAYMVNQAEEKLKTASIGKLFFSLALPAIISQFVNLLYNIVDRMFVGHIPQTGTTALTALGVCAPILTLVSSFAQLVSSGAAPLASISLGEGEREKANRILGNAFTAMLLMAAVLTAVLLLFTKPILTLFGASSATMPYAAAYLRIYACGNIFVLLTLGLNAFITAQGFAKISMKTVLLGAAINTILDPIFIYVFHLGVEGAALATVIAQGASAAWVLRFFLRNLGILRLRRRYMRLQPDVLFPALALGLAPFIMFATESLLVLTYNSSMLKYGGDLSVGMMTILTTLMQFLMLPAQGLAQGAQPIISYNYGAENAERVRQTFRWLILSAFCVTLMIFCLFMIYPKPIISIFTSDQSLINRTIWGIRIYFAAGILIGIQMASLQTLMALGKAGTSTFLSLLRKVFLLIPLIYLLPLFMANKVLAVIISEPIADVISVLTTIVIFTIQFRKTLRKMGKRY